MAYSEELLDQLRTSDNPFFISTYLDSPVLVTVIDRFRSDIEHFQSQGWNSGESRPGKDWKTLEPAGKDSLQLYCAVKKIEKARFLKPCEYGKFLREDLDIGESVSHIEKASSIAYRTYLDSIIGFSSWAQSTLLNGAQKVPSTQLFSSQMTEHELFWYARWRTLNKIVDFCSQANSKSKQRIVACQSYKSIKFARSENMVYLSLTRTSGGKTSDLLSWDQLLMMKDICYSRAQVLTGVRVIYNNDALLLEGVLSLMIWHEECLNRYLNEGYEILKSSESLSKAYLSIISGDILGEDGPFLRMVAKVELKERGLGLKFGQQSMARKFETILRKQRSIQSVVELFGLQKISGHPLVDPLKGGRAVAKTSREPDTTSYTDAQRISWNFKRIFLESYVNSNGWPNLSFTKKDTKLYSLYCARKRSLHRWSYPLTDWESCRFERVFEFDYASNYLELMDDKSISFYRSNIATGWNKEIEPESERRLLLELLSREDVDPKEIIRRIMRREIPEEWKVVCLYPKEREFKINPRMFAMMVFEMRLAWTLLEMNVADNVFKFLPQQTMTKSRLDTMKIFLDMTKPTTNDDMLTLMIESDLSSWCQHWRELVVHKVGNDLNDMFGMPGAYDYIHQFFKESMMVVRVNGCKPEGIDLPNPPESDLLYYNDLGGKEGIQQKTWTICTYSMMDLALVQLPLSYRLIGQADNQVKVLRFKNNRSVPVKKQMIEMRDKVLLLLKAECDKVNQELKPDECLESTTALTYSKDVYVSGVVYPTALKFHCRLFPHSSQDFPSIRTDLGAIFSTSIAGAERCISPAKSYYLALLQARIFLGDKLRGEGIHGDWVKQQTQALSRPQKQDLISTILLTPSEVGGYPVPTITSYIYKGGADPLSKALSGMIMARNGSKSRLPDRVLSQLDLSSLYKTTTTSLSILKDPYSLPLKTPITAIDGSTDMTSQALLPSVKNKAIYELMSESVTTFQNELADVLINVRPFNPLVLRDLLECSVCGISETIKKMFTATRTIQAVARRHNSSIIPTIIELERNQFMYVAKRYSSLPGDPWRCRRPYELAISLRQNWVKAGIPFPEVVTSYCPFDFNIKWGGEVLKQVGIHAVLTTSRSVALSSRGPYDPYVGGKTQEKRSEHGYKIIDSSTTAQAFRKLQSISSQMGDDQNMKTLVDRIGLSRSNIRLSRISDTLSQVKGGTMEHRYVTRAGHQSAHNMGSPNFSSHCVVSTDNSGKLSGGLLDYPHMVQPDLLVLLYLLEFFGDEIDLSRNAVMLDTESIDMEPLPNLTLMLEKEPDFDIVRFPGNPLAFIPNLKLEKVSPAMTASFRSRIDVRSWEVSVTGKADRLMIVEGWISDSLRTRSLSRTAADGGTSVLINTGLDLAELLSCGVEAFVQAASNCLADSFLMDSLRTIHSSRERWNMAAYVHQASEAVSRLFSNHLGHPEVKKDKFVRDHKLFDGPRYLPGASRSHERVKSIVTNYTLVNLIHSPRSYSKRKTVTFSALKGYTDLDKTLAKISRDLHHGVVHKEISPSDHRNIVDGLILPILRLPSDSVSKVAAIDTAALKLRQWADSRGFVGLASSMEDLIGGRAVGASELSSAEALRLTRVVSWSENQLSYRLSHKGEKIGGGMKAYCFDVKFCTEPMLACDQGLTTTVQSNRLSTLEKILSRAKANKGVSPSGPRGLFSMFCEFQGFFESKTVICVGVGEGATAAAALCCGALQVIGLDLRSDIPIRPHRFIDYRPPYVEISGHSNRFSYDPSTFTSDGDFFSADVSKSLLSHDTGTSTVVLDMEAGTPDDLSESLRPLIGNSYDGVVLYRTMTRMNRLEKFAAELKASGTKFRIVCLSVHDDNITALTVIFRCPMRIGETMAHCHIDVKCNELVGHDYRELRDWGDCLSNACLNVMMFGESSSILEAQKVINSYHDSLVSDPMNRISYDQWTDVMHAVISMEWARMDERTRYDMLKSWFVSGVVRYTTKKGTWTCTCTPRLLTHLSSVVTRIC